MSSTRNEVRVSREDRQTWSVWLDGRVVATYTLLTDALDHASMLECSPRARAAAAGAA